MRKRNCRVEIYFTKDELEKLEKKCRKAGMSREGYCRNVLAGVDVKEAPPAEYYSLIMEVRRVGNNINQILKKANSIGFVDVPMLKEALKENHATEAMLWKVFSNID